MLPYLNLFGIQVDSSLFFWGVGILVSQIYYQLFGRAYGFRWYQSLLFGVSFLLFEIIGAKILYIFEQFPYVLEHGVGFSGFSFFGIMFSVPLLTLPLAKIAKIPYGKLLDFASSGILIELAFYRVGCTLVGCCHGIPFPFGITYPEEGTLFPVQPLEAVLDLAIAILLIVLYKKERLFTGEQYLLYMIGYGLLRFVLEFLREREILFWTFSISHIWAALALLSGLMILFVLRGKKHCKEN